MSPLTEMVDELNQLHVRVGKLIDECHELSGAVTVLAKALRDIEAIAADEMDLDRHDLSSILHICHTGGVRAALEAS